MSLYPLRYSLCLSRPCTSRFYPFWPLATNFGSKTSLTVIDTESGSTRPINQSCSLCQRGDNPPAPVSGSGFTYFWGLFRPSFKTLHPHLGVESLRDPRLPPHSGPLRWKRRHPPQPLSACRRCHAPADAANGRPPVSLTASLYTVGGSDGGCAVVSVSAPLTWNHCVCVCVFVCVCFLSICSRAGMLLSPQRRCDAGHAAPSQH